MNDIFEKASRLKLRFIGFGGALSVEDLWDLPLQHNTRPNLDDIAKDLNRQVKEAEGETSFVKPANNSLSEKLALSFEIVKHVINVKVTERDARQEATARAEKKQKLLALIDTKQNQELEGKSLEELQKMVNDL